MAGQWWALLVAVVTSGGWIVDRWVYRRRPALDVAALAQQIAERALAQAHAELSDAYADADRWRKEAAALREEATQLRTELAAARGEIARLVDLLRRAGTRL